MPRDVARVAFGGLSFAHASPWSDASVVFEAPRLAGVPTPNIVVRRGPVGESDALVATARRILLEAKRDHPSLDVVDQRTMLVAGRPAILMRCTEAGGGPCTEQTLVIVETGEGSTRETVVFAAAAPAEDAAAVRAVLSELLESVRVHTNELPHSERPVVAPSSRPPPSPLSLPVIPMPGARR
jgi:hypothetical protein